MLKRLENLRKEMRKKDIEAVFVDKKEDVTYLSGFLGDDAFLFITDNHSYIITDFRYIEQAKREAVGYEVIKDEDNIWKEIDKSIKRVGIQEENITYARYKKYKSKLSNVEFVSIENILRKLRIKKTKKELENIKVAAKIADKAFSHILKYIKAGVREMDVALELEYFMKKNKASGVSFETIVASGVRTCMPHGVASDKIIENGDTVTLDYGALYNNYCSDMTRTVFVGEPNRDVLDIYDIVKKAQLEGIKKAQDGIIASEVDKVSRDIIQENGYGDYFGHALGHGVGMEVHEWPRLSHLSDVKLEDGMVVTIEPGIYVPGLGGVRIEDMLVIRNDVPEVLTKSSKDVFICF